MIENLGHITLNNGVNGHIATNKFEATPIGTIEDHMVLGRTFYYQVKCLIDKRQGIAMMTSNRRTFVQ